jgi:5S rRNA maturation endonuclease (ribonuclease M5)
VTTATRPQAFDRVLDALERHGARIPSERGGRAQALCPAHADRSPSLSITRIEGSVLIHCHAGCPVDEILDAIQLTKADLFDDPRGSTYTYADLNGDVVRRVHRTPDKRFRQTGHDNTKPTTLYRLDKVTAAVAAGQPVWLVEGEKDVHALETVGVVATTAPMGAANWTKVDATPLTGADVVAVVDADEKGDQWATDVEEALAGNTRTLRFVRAAEGKDAADHIAAGHQLDSFAAYEPPTNAHTGARLQFHTLGELRAIVAARGPRKYMLRGLWPEGDYGVLAAEPKAQKTMATTDLAVAVASGTPWLGLIEVDTPGPVVMFVGEGGEGNTVRRLAAAAQARGIDPDTLPIHICTRAPHLNNVGDLAELALKIDQVEPTLVTLDPLYLAARGAELGDIYKMGALLENAQIICQRRQASLWVVHHFNRQNGNGPGRMAGAGPQEWGRILISVALKSRRTDPDTKATTVITELAVQGGEIADRKIRLTRKTWTDDPDDLDSAMHIENTATWTDDPDIDGDQSNTADDGTTTTHTPGARKLLRALTALGRPASIKDLGDWMAEHDAPPLKRETCSRNLNKLAADGHVDSVPGESFAPTLWFLSTPRDSRDVTRDGHTDPSRVTRVTAPIGGHASHGHTSHEQPDPPGHTTPDPDQPPLPEAS